MGFKYDKLESLWYKESKIDSSGTKCPNLKFTVQNRKVVQVLNCNMKFIPPIMQPITQISILMVSTQQLLKQITIPIMQQSDVSPSNNETLFTNSIFLWLSFKWMKKKSYDIYHYQTPSHTPKRKCVLPAMYMQKRVLTSYCC